MNTSIRSVTVVYDDGETQTWTGRGTAEVFRTPNEARGAPILRDSDLSYVSVVLPFDRPVEASDEVPAAPVGAASPKVVADAKPKSTYAAPAQAVVE